MRNLLSANAIALLLCPLCLGAGRGQTATDPKNEPMGDNGVLVKAWRKTGKPKAYQTRTLDHLAGFQPRSVPLDKYGGWAGRKVEATGFFHVRKLAGRWWLIDPEGHRFLHVGVVSVRVGTGPQMKKAFAAKFSSPQDWAEKTMRLLREHGFHGTGAWSDDELTATASQRPVTTPNWNFMSTYAGTLGKARQVAGHKAYPNDCILVFDPGFEAFAFEHARKLAATAADPYLLGHYSDNELPFPRDLLDKALQLPADDWTRKAAEKWLARRQGGKLAPDKLTLADREAWRGHVAERYFDLCARAIRKFDPNHLYLGPRLYGSEKSSQAVLAAAGRHLDAIAINVYGVWTPDVEGFQRWTEWSGRPVIVTEWYAKGADSGMGNLTGAGWTVPTQADRGRFYQNFTLGLLETKCCVGWHWFKYYDNDPTDTKTDPSNRDSNKGIVNVRYEPYEPLLAAMKQLNRTVYPLTEFFDRE